MCFFTSRNLLCLCHIWSWSGLPGWRGLPQLLHGHGPGGHNCVSSHWAVGRPFLVSVPHWVLCHIFNTPLYKCVCVCGGGGGLLDSLCLSICPSVVLSVCPIVSAWYLLNHSTIFYFLIFFLANLVLWCIIMRWWVIYKNLFTLFIVKVTPRAYLIKIWLFLLYFLNYWSVCNQSWFASTAS